MCWLPCHIWNLTKITFSCRTMKLYIVFFLAVVNRGTSNNQPTEGMSCEMVRLSPYSGPLTSCMRLGPPCYRHGANSCGLWEGKPSQDQTLRDGRGGLCWVGGCSSDSSWALSFLYWQHIKVGNKEGSLSPFFNKRELVERNLTWFPQDYRDSVADIVKELRPKINSFISGLSSLCFK